MENLNFKEATMIVQFDEGGDSSERYNNHKQYLKEMKKQNIISSSIKRYGLSKASKSAYCAHLIIKTGTVEDMKKEYTVSQDFKEKAEEIRSNLPGSIRADYSVMNFDPPGFSNNPKGFNITMGQLDEGYYKIDEEII